MFVETIYSALTEEVATVGYFLEDYNMKLSTTLKIKPSNRF